ncbi:MAG: hypothetical protein H7Y42_12335 [Chitinophagaceae bacterium]|nr:hypothetical protein [Chitinophagaceae bacterium]
MIVLNNKYEFGDIVYLKTDTDQHPRIVTAFISCPAGDILYEVNCGTIASRHYEFEITADKVVQV